MDADDSQGLAWEITCTALAKTAAVEVVLDDEEKEAIEMEFGKGVTITKYGKVNYMGQRSILGFVDYGKGLPKRVETYYKEFGIYKYYVDNSRLFPTSALSS